MSRSADSNIVSGGISHGGLSDVANDEALYINTTSTYAALAKRLRENVPKPDIVNLTTQGCEYLEEIQVVLDALVNNTTVSRLTVYGDFFSTGSEQHHTQLVESLVHVLTVNKTIRTIRFVERGRKLRRSSSKGSALEAFLGVLEQVGDNLSTSLQALSIDDPFTISMEAATKLERLFTQHHHVRAELYLTLRSVDVFHKVLLAIEQMQQGATLSIQNLISRDEPIRKICQVMDHITSLDIAVAQTSMLTQLGEAACNTGRLESLVINVTPLTGYHADSIVSFFQQLRYARSLRHLGFFWYRQTIPRDATNAMVEALINNESLQSFAFKHHLWRDDPTEELLGALGPALSYLKKFSLGVSVVGSRGESSDADAWTTALRNNASLECLEVTSLLSTPEVLAIVKALPTMAALKQVTMTPKEKRFGQADAGLVVEAVKASPTLTDLRSSTMFLSKAKQSEVYYHCMRRKVGADKILKQQQEDSDDNHEGLSENKNSKAHETPLSLWPLMLAQLDKGKWISLQYDFIRQKADVLIPKGSSCSHATTKQGPVTETEHPGSAIKATPL